jgi:hypothetical protein
MLLHGNSKYVLLLLVIFRHENTDMFFWRGYILIENDANNFITLFSEEIRFQNFLEIHCRYSLISRSHSCDADIAKLCMYTPTYFTQMACQVR